MAAVDSAAGQGCTLTEAYLGLQGLCSGSSLGRGQAFWSKGLEGRESGLLDYTAALGKEVVSLY